jgi:DNA-binding NarL/FixJ family response regulator
MAIVVAVAGAGDIVAQGLKHILGQAPDLEIADDYPATFHNVGVLPDVVLYDVGNLERDGGTQLTDLIEALEAAVVVVGRDLRPGLAAWAISQGASGCVSIEAPADEVLSIIRKAAGGQLDVGDQPVLGSAANLGAAEARILADIVAGYSNTQITERQSLSINTVKSYIRVAYRKMGVTTRAQAVAWGIQHGFPSTGDPPLTGS